MRDVWPTAGPDSSAVRVGHASPVPPSRRCWRRTRRSARIRGRVASQPNSSPPRDHPSRRAMLALPSHLARSPWTRPSQPSVLESPNHWTRVRTKIVGPLRRLVPVEPGRAGADSKVFGLHGTPDIYQTPFAGAPRTQRELLSVVPDDGFGGRDRRAECPRYIEVRLSRRDRGPIRSAPNLSSATGPSSTEISTVVPCSRIAAASTSSYTTCR
jgi:hypothetical protein